MRTVLRSLLDGARLRRGTSAAAACPAGTGGRPSSFPSAGGSDAPHAEPPMSFEGIVRAHPALMSKLRHVVAGDDATFHDRCALPIVAAAALIHRLPAATPGLPVERQALLRRCLEIAVHARQAAEGRLFTPRCGAEARHAMEPRWRHAVFLAGLLCDLPRMAVDAAPVESTGVKAALAGVDDAAICAQLQAVVPRVTAAWLDGGPRPLMAALHRVLCDLSRDVVCNASCNDAPGAASALADVVSDTRRRVVAAAAASRADPVPCDRTRARPVGHDAVEPGVSPLSREEVALAAQWSTHLADGRTDRVVWLPGPGLAVCAEACGPAHPQPGAASPATASLALAHAAALLQRRRWLGRGDWPAPNARVGLLPFGRERKPGLVVNADGLFALGLLHR